MPIEHDDSSYRYNLNNLELLKSRITSGSKDIEMDIYHLEKITIDGAKLLASLITHNNCPQNLKISLSSWSDDAIKILCENLIGGKCKSGLQITLSDLNIISTQYLLNAIKSKKLPHSSKLNFNYVELKTIENIAELIKSGHCQSNITLGLRYCGYISKFNIAKEERTANILAKSLANRNCPINLTLQLNVDYCMLVPILNMIKSGKCAQGLAIEGVHVNLTDAFSDALNKNNIMHTALACLRVHNAFVNQGVTDTLSSDVLKLIYAFTFPDLNAVDMNQIPLSIKFANNVVTFFNDKIMEKRSNIKLPSKRACIIV